MEEQTGKSVKIVTRKKVKRLAIRTARDWSDRSVGTYASSMAFFFFMSLIPLLILLMQLLPLVHLTEVELLLFIEQMIPESAYDLARRIVSEAYRASGSVALLSALVLLWSASRGTIALRWGLNRLYDAEENRPLPLLYIISIGYTIIMLVIFVLMVVVIFAGPVSAFLTMELPELFENPITIKFRQRLLLEVLLIAAFSLVYTFIPAGKRKLSRQIPGAFIVTILWQVFSYFFSLYLRSANTYTMFYGSLGMIAIMLLWMYGCFYILLIGAFINRFCDDYGEKIMAVFILPRR